MFPTSDTNTNVEIDADSLAGKILHSICSVGQFFSAELTPSNNLSTNIKQWIIDQIPMRMLPDDLAGSTSIQAAPSILRPPSESSSKNGVYGLQVK